MKHNTEFIWDGDIVNYVDSYPQEEAYSKHITSGSSHCVKIGMIMLSGLISANLNAVEPKINYLPATADNIEVTLNEIVDVDWSQPDFLKQQWADEVSSLASLLDNWDGEGAQRMSTKSICHVLNILDNPRSRVDIIDDIYPNQNGFVSVVWRNKQNDIVSLEVGRTLMSYFCRNNNVKEFYNRCKIDNNELNNLFQRLAKL